MNLVSKFVQIVEKRSARGVEMNFLDSRALLEFPCLLFKVKKFFNFLINCIDLGQSMASY